MLSFGFQETVKLPEIGIIGMVTKLGIPFYDCVLWQQRNLIAFFLFCSNFFKEDRFFSELMTRQTSDALVKIYTLLIHVLYTNAQSVPIVVTTWGADGFQKASDAGLHSLNLLFINIPCFISNHFHTFIPVLCCFICKQYMYIVFL